MPQKDFKVFGIATWPISNILAMTTLEKPTAENVERIKPSYKVKALHGNLKDWVEGLWRIVPYYTLTLICDYFYSIEQQMQESNEGINKFLNGDMDLSNQMWILKITARDLIVTLAVAYFWQQIVYRIFQENMRALKFSKNYQKQKDMDREVYYSVCTLLWGTFWEVLAMYLYATGKVNTQYLDWNQNRYQRYFWIIISPIFRDGYFWITHRMMHDWDTEYIPDLGKLLYKYSHSIHHQSRNIQPWSGISMHPIEGFIYESAMFIPLFFTHHPIMLNFLKIDLNYAAILGHDGHEYPGGGDWFHTIHHMKIKGNYGSANCPFDWLFGTVDYGDDLGLDQSAKEYQNELKQTQAEQKKAK